MLRITITSFLRIRRKIGTEFINAREDLKTTESCAKKPKKIKISEVKRVEWDIQDVLKNVFGKIVEVGFNEDGKHADIYLKNLLNPLREYIYMFFEVVDAKQVLPRDYQLYSQFMKAIADIFVGVEAFLSGVLDRAKLLNLLHKNEKTLLASDATTLFLGS